MGSPIATKKADFMCYAFPDICTTQVGTNPVPIPYPNIGYLSDVEGFSENVYVGGDPIIHQDSEIPNKKTTGDEAGSIGGIKSGITQGSIKFATASSTVFVNNNGVVRMYDTTKQNCKDEVENAVGTVLGGVPNVLVGG